MIMTVNTMLKSRINLSYRCVCISAWRSLRRWDAHRTVRVAGPSSCQAPSQQIDRCRLLIHTSWYTSARERRVRGLRRTSLVLIDPAQITLDLGPRHMATAMAVKDTSVLVIAATEHQYCSYPNNQGALASERGYICRSYHEELHDRCGPVRHCRRPRACCTGTEP